MPAPRPRLPSPWREPGRLFARMEAATQIRAHRRARDAARSRGDDLAAGFYAFRADVARDLVLWHCL